MAEQLPAMVDRIQLAVQLREAGFDVDVESWDGLDDDQVLSIVSHWHVSGADLPLREKATDEI